jgi:hypothetical protein
VRARTHPRPEGYLLLLAARCADAISSVVLRGPLADPVHPYPLDLTCASGNGAGQAGDLEVPSCGIPM